MKPVFQDTVHGDVSQLCWYFTFCDFWSYKQWYVVIFEQTHLRKGSITTNQSASAVVLLSWTADLCLCEPRKTTVMWRLSRPGIPLLCNLPASQKPLASPQRHYRVSTMGFPAHTHTRKCTSKNTPLLLQWSLQLGRETNSFPPHTRSPDTNRDSVCSVSVSQSGL